MSLNGNRHHSTIGDRNILQKKTPVNLKYSNVKSSLDTGSSLTKHLERLKEKEITYKFKKNELFKRMKPITFGKLILETSFEYKLEEYEANNNLEQPQFSLTKQLRTNSRFGHGHPSDMSSQKPVQNYINNFSDSLVLDNDTDQLSQELQRLDVQKQISFMDLPFLLLDVRDLDLYQQCHIVTAHHYSPSMLSRESQFTKEILMFRNRLDKLIVIYDDDESIAPDVCQRFSERGISNVWMLSGGLKLTASKVKGIYIGPLPRSCLNVPKTSPSKQPSRYCVDSSSRCTRSALPSRSNSTMSHYTNSTSLITSSPKRNPSPRRKNIDEGSLTNESRLVGIDIQQPRPLRPSHSRVPETVYSPPFSGNNNIPDDVTITPASVVDRFNLEELKQSLYDAECDPTPSDWSSNASSRANSRAQFSRASNTASTNLYRRPSASSIAGLSVSGKVSGGLVSGDGRIRKKKSN